MLAAIPDPRGRKGRRHPLAAMLAVIVCGLLTGARGYKAIAQSTRVQGASVWHWLGFQRRPPCANSFGRGRGPLKKRPLAERGCLADSLTGSVDQIPDDRLIDLESPACR